MSIGATIRRRRRERRLTLDMLGKLVGCARSYLSAIENGRRGAPSAELLDRLERALRFDPGELVALADRSRLRPTTRAHLDALEADRGAARRLAALVLRASSSSREARQLAERILAGVDPGELSRGLPVLLEREFDAWPTHRNASFATIAKRHWIGEWADAAFGVHLETDTMAPEYRAGDVVLLGDSIEPTWTDTRAALIRTEQGAIFCRMCPTVGGAPDQVVLVTPGSDERVRLIRRDDLIACHPVVAVIQPSERGKRLWVETGPGG